jgi:hypothetical protein
LPDVKALARVRKSRTLRYPLRKNGAFAPARFTLDRGMSPLAFNLHTDFEQDAIEFGKWNVYHAELRQGGTVLATRKCSVNHPQSNA